MKEIKERKLMMTIEEYTSYKNHLMIQRFIDVDFWVRASTVDALTIL